MDGFEYQTMAMRTNDGKAAMRMVDTMASTNCDLATILEACLGIAGEGGELIDMVKKWIFHGAELDEAHLERELGDILWYIALLCHAMDWDMGGVMSTNIKKLWARYPDGFSPERANNKQENDL